MEIEKPLFFPNNNDINGNHVYSKSLYDTVYNQTLTLSMAISKFVQLSGFNIINSYNYLTNQLYSSTSIASNIITCQKITCDSIVVNDIKCLNFNNNLNLFDIKIIVNNLTFSLNKDIIDLNFFDGIDFIQLLQNNNFICLINTNKIKISFFSNSGLCILFKKSIDKGLYFSSTNLSTLKYIKIHKYV
jgi:hypothetical protein